MHERNPRPIVIGSGLTGLLISLALSKAQIEHVLIGGPPPVGSPRLGESLNLNATLYLLSEFPELSACYYRKDFVKVISGELCGGFVFSFNEAPIENFTMTALGHKAPNAFLHLDRVLLDAALFEKAILSPHCHHLDARVEQLLCAPRSDRIEQITLQDGDILPASHVFDATGHIRLVARQMHVQRRMLGATQRLVYAHYHRHKTSVSSISKEPWYHSTTIIRLFREHDGVDGMAWSIPLGNTCSVGVTISRDEGNLSDEALLTITSRAFAHNNVDYQRHYPSRSRIASGEMELYTHARAYGANWLLASAAHSQIHWMSSAGLDTSVMAAVAAVPFLSRPEVIGNRYQAGLRQLDRVNDLWTWILKLPYGSYTEEDVVPFENQLIWSTRRRWLNFVALEDRGWLSQATTSIFGRLSERGIAGQLPLFTSVSRVRSRA